MKLEPGALAGATPATASAASPAANPTTRLPVLAFLTKSCIRLPLPLVATALEHYYERHSPAAGCYYDDRQNSRQNAHGQTPPRPDDRKRPRPHG